MTKSYLAQVIIPNKTNRPEDVVVNTFSFLGPDIPTEPERTSLTALLLDFYNGIHVPSSTPIVAQLSNVLDTVNTKYKLFRRTDPVPRVPVFTEPLPLAPTNPGALPNEVALCMSFSASVVSGTNAARRRGRIYLGPFVPSTSISTTGDMRPNDALIGSIVAAGADLMTSASGAWTWIVHSSIAGDATVVRGWVDDAWDTQRRRGTAPRFRTTW